MLRNVLVHIGDGDGGEGGCGGGGLCVGQGGAISISGTDLDFSNKTISAVGGFYCSDLSSQNKSSCEGNGQSWSRAGVDGTLEIIHSGALTTTNTTISYRGVDSAVTSTKVGSGVGMTVNTSTLVSGNVTKLSSSAPTQLIVGTTNLGSAVTYNVKSSTAPVTITQMTFTVAPSIDHLTSMTIGGLTKTVTATSGFIFDGLNLAVPAGAAGLDIPVGFTFGNVDTNGGVSSSTTADVLATLTAIRYTSGNTTTDLGSLSLASNGMQLVGSKPSVTTDATQKTGLILGSENKIGEGFYVELPLAENDCYWPNDGKGSMGKGTW